MTTLKFIDTRFNIEALSSLQSEMKRILDLFTVHNSSFE
jgi:hypothetical protein